MNKKPKQAILFLYEGDTEGGFYDLLFDKLDLTRKVQLKKKCINGNFNINQKIADKAYEFLKSDKHKHIKYLTIIVAYDREDSRDKVTTRTNIPEIKKRLGSSRVKNIHEIIATQMLESWFFIDIDGIYNFLQLPKNKRTPDKYKDYEKFTSKDLDDLFKQQDKRSRYRKGYSSTELVRSLDLKKIYSKCSDLNIGINKVFSIASLKPPS